jgi:molybdenum cofactor biosynthesis protein A
MPHEGLNWLQKESILSYEEMLRLCGILVKNGVDKIRITGGEPFVRKDIMGFLHQLSRLDGISDLSITTNGVLTASYIPELKKLGIRSVNLSLDTLDRDRFLAITYRDELERVMDTLSALLKHEMNVKVNAVVMPHQNIEDIVPMVELTKSNKISVRFIEEMPFNGTGSEQAIPEWDHVRILQKIKEHFPAIHKIQDPPNSTAYNYAIPGHKGTVGIIAAYTRSFCGTCNRIRITPDGTLKTCLYDDGVLNVRDVMRQNISDEELQHTLTQAIYHKYKDGLEAEQKRKAGNSVHESMATIGG